MGTTETSAGYNFVPLSRKVVFPDWADQVSQDIPFKDGISGTIECELEATSPIYVRNGGEGDESEAFFQVDGRYMIPGSSLKGMIRNVIEIASFGKMEHINFNRYGVRDLHNKRIYGDKMTKRVGGGYEPLPEAGWLREDSETGNWTIDPCDFARIEQEDLEKYCRGLSLGNKQSSKQKYEQFTLPLKVEFECEEMTNYSHSCGELRYRRAKLANKGGLHGTLVFTGQPGQRQTPGKTDSRGNPKSRGKHMEFIFFNRQDAPVSASHRKKDFEFIHAENGNLENPNEEWKYWKARLKDGGEVPVFFIKAANALDSMGLALMYRLPYAYSIGDLLDSVNHGIHLDCKSDLAECLFGHVDSRRLHALKGRVQFNHALAESAEPANRVTTVLGGPKPTYYPNYLEQPKIKDGNSEYKTMMDRDTRLRGWKRYPARTVAPQFPQTLKGKVATSFIPLEKGARFRFALRVHNLKPVELSALCWALEWGGNQSLCHGLGMAKNFGQGQARVKVSEARLHDCRGTAVDLPGYAPFVTWVGAAENVPGWDESEQIFQLLAMANPASLGQEEQKTRFRQMELPQFAERKGGRNNPKACLPEHKPFPGEPDAKRFNSFEYESQAEKAAKEEQKRLQAEKEKASRLKLVQQIDQWGALRETVLDREEVYLYRTEPGYAQAVKDAAEKIRAEKPEKWSKERDEQLATWLEPVGLSWSPMVTDQSSAISTLDADCQKQVEEIGKLKDWAQFVTAELDMQGLCRPAQTLLKEKFQGWGCHKSGKKAKNPEKNKEWKKLQGLLK